MRPGDAERRAVLFLDALTGNFQLKCLLGPIESPSRAERQQLIDAAVACFVDGLEP